MDSPAAWYGRDYQDRFDEWALQLTPQHIAELDAAVKHVLANKTIVQEGNYLNLVSPGAAAAAQYADIGLPAGLTLRRHAVPVQSIALLQAWRFG